MRPPTPPAGAPWGPPSMELAAASRRLRRPPGRPRRVLAPQPPGFSNQGAATEAAPTARIRGVFALSLPFLPPRGLPLEEAARYSGIPKRRLWEYIGTGRLPAIRPPGMRRVLLDRADLDALLAAWKTSP